MKHLAFIFLAAMALASCRATVESPGLRISAPGVQVHDGGGFCPPGQAKKGRC